MTVAVIGASTILSALNAAISHINGRFVFQKHPPTNLLQSLSLSQKASPKIPPNKKPKRPNAFQFSEIYVKMLFAEN